MVRSKTGEIEGVGATEYQRLYIPNQLRTDSTYPFTAGDPVRLQLVETTCEREVLVVVPETLEVDVEETEIEIKRSTREIQTDLVEGST